jgi:hypothetical protein
MATKSTVIGLPILPFNQSKHSDVCQYLDHMQDFLYDVYYSDDQQSSESTLPIDITLKDKVLKDVKVPLCGDLLGRERVTGAKKTRLGCDTSCEQFKSIVEYPALWHTKQSFLGVSLNTFIDHIYQNIGFASNCNSFHFKKWNLFCIVKYILTLKYK